MNHPDNLMLYVAKPEASATFYAELLGIQPVEQSPTFVLFILQSGLKLSLWSRHTVHPAPANIGGGCEFSMRLETRDAVDALYQKWRDLKVDILMTPAQLEFGWSFVVADPDGHRLRIYALDM